MPRWEQVRFVLFGFIWVGVLHLTWSTWNDSVSPPQKKVNTHRIEFNSIFKVDLSQCLRSVERALQRFRNWCQSGLSKLSSPSFKLLHIQIGQENRHSYKYTSAIEIMRCGHIVCSQSSHTLWMAPTRVKIVRL